MVYLYAADVSGLLDPWENPELLEGLPLERQEKIQKCQQEDKRKQSFGAGLLIKHALETHGVQAEEMISNMSHSGTLVICALSEKAVGCDTECLKEAPGRVSERFFCESEKVYLNQFQGKAYDRQFFRLWTIKESYMKMTREGMKLPFHQFEVNLGERITIIRDGKVQLCYIKEYDVADYLVTVCAESDAFAEMSWVNL
mgnify:FL=1